MPGFLVARFVFVLALVCAFTSGCGSPIPPAGNYATVSGTVSDDTGKGISDAVVVVNAVQFATTDAEGRFRITNVPTGLFDYGLSQVPAGYKAPAPVDNAPALQPGEQRTIAIVLQHT
jgi:hypothetical protein